MLACGTLHTAPSLPTLTVLEKTLKADLVASIQSLTPLSHSISSSSLRFCSSDLTTGSHMSFHSQLFPWSNFPFMSHVTYLLYLLSSLHCESISCISFMNAIRSSAWNCLLVTSWVASGFLFSSPYSPWSPCSLPLWTSHHFQNVSLWGSWVSFLLAAFLQLLCVFECSSSTLPLKYGSPPPNCSWCSEAWELNRITHRPSLHVQ